jgi:hypothetical protein
VLYGPLDRQRQGTSRQTSCDHFERANVDLSLVLPVQRMKMGRRMFAPKHLNDDPEELADRGHVNTLTPVNPKCRELVVAFRYGSDRWRQRQSLPLISVSE